jgi:hypothetical protein
MVYNTATAGTSPSNVTPGIYYYDGTKWQRVINQQPDATVEFSVNADPNTGGTSFNGTAASKDYVYVSTINASQWVYNGTAYVTYTPPASTAWYTTGGTSDAGSNKTGGIYRTGNVGIGTSPSATLEVGKPDGTIPGYVVLNPTTSGSGLEGAEITLVKAPGVPSASNWSIDQISNGSNPRFRIFASSIGEANGISIEDAGFVGIGNSNPTQKLDVTGNILASGTITQSSDIRLKEITEKLNSEDGINTIKYTWKDGRDDRTHIGYGAQEVEAVLPHAVYTDDADSKAVNYIEVHTYKLQLQEERIKALDAIVQQQQAEIDELKKRMEVLLRMSKRKRNIFLK